MKKYLLTVLVFVLLAILFIALRFKGALPAVLPPSPPRTNTETGNTPVKNDLGLKLAEGFSIDIYAQDLGAPRDLLFDQNNTLLASISSRGQIVALPDKDADGRADKTITILENLKRPHGLAFFDNNLYVAQETQVARYIWDSQNFVAKLDKSLFNLPAGGRHFTRTIAFRDDGTMYVSLGSTCDVCYENHPYLAAIIVSDKNGKLPEVFAKGLRNSVFITVNRQTQKLWATEMGRDFLGDRRPPDEINIIEKDKDYGWPNCFGDKIPDTNFSQSADQRPCQNTQTPAYQICAHCAPLGLTFITSAKFPQNWQGDLLVSYHGSWNSSIPVGYKVVRLNVEGEKVAGEEDFLSDFLQGNQTKGRPVDLAFSQNGDLFISDDKAGVIYRIYK